LLNRNWSAEWERLPAVKLPGSRAAEAGQITIRLAASALAALKSLAKRKTLPYHALARSWIVGSLSRETLPSVDVDLTDVGLAADAQLNIKIDSEVLLALKRFAHGRHVPYHRLARLWIYEGLRSEQAWARRAETVRKITMADLMLLLLHARGPKGSQDESIKGITRLVKLLFVASQRLGGGPRDLFYAYSYGPFTDAVFDAKGALAAEGLLAGESEAVDLPSFEQMKAAALRKGKSQGSVPLFQLSAKGRRVAEGLTREDPRLQDIMAVIESVKRIYGVLSDDRLLERVYEEYPAFAEKSIIRQEVRERAKARSRRQRP